jgi:hypothetical protein
MDITYPSGTVTQNGNTFLFTPALPLQVSTTYQLNMGAVTDLSGNVSTPVNRTFTTAGTSAYDYTSLTIVSTSPANGDVGIPINNPIAVTFNKAVDPTTVSTATFGITTTGFPMLGSFSVSGNVVTFTPSQPRPAASSVRFQPGLGYYGAMQDLYGNKLESFTSYSFKTAAPTDTTPPQLTALIPAPGTTLVSPVALFRMTFSKTVSTGNNGLDIFVGSQLVNSSAVYDLEDRSAC